MDRILFNGIIRTLDDENRVVEAIGLENGVIKFIGSNEEASLIECDETTDLQGKLVLPGFVDGHLHMVHYAFVENSIKLFDCRNGNEIVDKCKYYINKNSSKEIKWIFSRGWNEENFTNKVYPTKNDANMVSEDVPVIFVRVCGHIAVINDVGLNRLKSIPEYQLIKDDIDESNGVIKENAVQFFYSVLEKPSEEDVEDYIQYSMRQLNKAGITSIHSEDLSSLPGKDWRLIIKAYDNLNEKNKMSVKVYEQCLFEKKTEFQQFIHEGYAKRSSGKYFTLGPLKILMDGALGAKTAALSEPYIGETENYGVINYTQDELDSMINLAADNGMNSVVHCIGDRAMKMTIKSMDKVQKAHTQQKMRNSIVHAQITNKDVLDEMKKHNISALIQPVFIESDMDIVESRIGRERMSNIYAWNTMNKMGIKTLGGSDAPVESFNILNNIYFAVARKKKNGTPECGWMPEEKLTVDEAVKLFTKNASYFSYTENTNGTIEIGKTADLVILDRDIYTGKEEDILNTNVSETIIDGRTVYKNQKS